MRISFSRGIKIASESWKLGCDITNSQYFPLVFYSHAHSDHIPRKIPKTKVICSSITRVLVENFVSNYEDGEFYESHSIDNTIFSQVPSGHIIGSTALIIDSPDNKVIYTGDVSIRNKGFLEPFKPEKCDKLIIESTFGTPKYTFPRYDEVIKETQEQIQKYLEEGIPVVLMGYALGKAQMLYHSFSHLSDTNILHGSNEKINSLLAKNGIDGSITALTYQDAKDGGLLEETNNWILFSPLRSGRNEFNAFLKKKFGVKFFAFSGWAISPNYKYQMAVDHAIPISDHADFSELIEICEKCNPREIYTVYGPKIQLAAELRKRGFKATPLSKQTLLESFF